MEKKLTGYPSIDKPWLKYYKEGAFERAQQIPYGKTVWDTIEERLEKYRQYPAIEYFGKTISRKEFQGNVYAWAKAFKALGVKEDEVVVFYGPSVPDVCAMTLALNHIGAVSYFLKLAISAEALAEETREASVAVVFDDMWANVAKEFSKERFRKVIVYSVTDDMPSPVRLLVKSSNCLKGKNPTQSIAFGSKFLRATEAKKMGNAFNGKTKADFVPGRTAFITSSSGTTVGGAVKGCVATNESSIAQLLLGEASEMQYYPGDKTLANLPLTASTSLNCLFLMPLHRGTTILLDPRVSGNDFYRQICKGKPNAFITTGSMMEEFTHRISSDNKKGKHYDFSFAKGWSVGGEGAHPSKIRSWKRILKENKCEILYNGYGCSELFSSIVSETPIVDSNQDSEKKVSGVGIPCAGITIGIFDENGKELTYNQRGELWATSKTMMKEYYCKPELTSSVLVDGWIHTGDMAEIDENGFIYIWGRMTETIILENADVLYLFDVAAEIRTACDCEDVVVLPSRTKEGKPKLVAHIAWSSDKTMQNREHEIKKADAALQKLLNDKIREVGFVSYNEVLPYSPTTLKRDKNKMVKEQETAEQQVFVYKN